MCNHKLDLGDYIYVVCFLASLFAMVYGLWWGNANSHRYECLTDTQCYEECVQIGGLECE